MRFLFFSGPKKNIFRFFQVKIIIFSFKFCKREKFDFQLKKLKNIFFEKLFFSAQKKSKISKMRWNFFIRSSIPIRYILNLSKKPKTEGISLYSSRLQALSAQTPLKVAERPTFTLRASYNNSIIIITNNGYFSNI